MAPYEVCDSRLSRVLAGPLRPHLADLGAQVLKVENPHGGMKHATGARPGGRVTPPAPVLIFILQSW